MNKKAPEPAKHLELLVNRQSANIFKRTSVPVLIE
jgi:hypothetical protein